MSSVKDIDRGGHSCDRAKSKAHVLSEVCSSLASGKFNDASHILREQYPFAKVGNAGRKWTSLQALRVFVRDGFIDRYSGCPLVFPGTLRIISSHLPMDFPFHPNWKTDECHFAYWELVPTIDHVVPVSRGGADNETNWVTTSMVKNAAKANFTLEEIGWQLYPEGTGDSWDGLTSWFSEQVTGDPNLLENAYIQNWDRALRAITVKHKSSIKSSKGE
jgi:hypothetical protein